MNEFKRIVMEATDLATKVKIGLEFIEKARKEGKDVAEWEKSVDNLQRELDLKIQAISQESDKNTI